MNPSRVKFVKIYSQQIKLLIMPNRVFVINTRSVFYGNFYHTQCGKLVFYRHSGDFCHTCLLFFTMRVVIYDILIIAIITTLL